MLKKSNKKGISPIVATTVLVGFVVLVIVIIIFWGRGFAQEQAEKQGAIAEAENKCLSTSIDIGRSAQGLTIFNVGSVGVGGLIIIQDCGSQEVETIIRNSIAVSDSLELNKKDLSVSCGTGTLQFPDVLYGDADEYLVIPYQSPSPKPSAPAVPCTEEASVRVRN